MPYNNNLSNAKKDKLFPIKLDEQNFCCILCKFPFEKSIFWEQSTHFDHLNCNEKDNDPANTGIVHIECNFIKKWYGEYQVRAMEWHRYLVSKITSSLSASEKKTYAKTDRHTDELTDGQINLIINKLTKSQLDTELPEDSTEQISFSMMLSDIHFLTMQETGGRGSEPSARRALNGMTKSQFSPWMQKKLGKGNIIIQRRVKTQIEKKLPELQRERRKVFIK